MMSGFLFARGWYTEDNIDWYYLDFDGQKETDVIKPSGDDKYYLDTDGLMVRDYLLENYNNSVYYFDDDGKMVKNTWVAVEPTQVEFGMDSNAPTIYLYYFGQNGKAFKARNGVTRKTIDGKKYLFNENGQMMFGWINEDGERLNEYESNDDPFKGYCYFAGDETDGVLREGWMEYRDGSVDDNYYKKESLYLYFKPGDNKKHYAKNGEKYIKKSINGKTYAFDENGISIQGWDSEMVSDLETTTYYFSENQDDPGRMHKKEWVYTVPSKIQNENDHDMDIERWFYSNGNGNIAKNTLKKINKSYFVFDKEGIMKTGLCIVEKSTNEYIDTIDLERTDGKDFIISRYYVSHDKIDTGDKLEYSFFDDKTMKIFYFTEENNGEEDEEDENVEVGKRKTGLSKVAFSDDDYDFYSNGVSEYEGKKKKRYYQAGMRLKADSDLGLGLVLLGYSTATSSTAVDLGDMSYYMYDSWTDPKYEPNVYSNEDRNHKVIVDNVEKNEYIKTDYIVDMTPMTCKTNAAYPVFIIVDKSGNKVSKNYSYKKDRDGNYWMIGGNGAFIKAYEVPIKYDKREGRWYFKSEFIIDEDSLVSKNKTEYRPFGTIDAYGRTCSESRDESKDYEIRIDDIYALNFRFVDNY